MQFPAIFSLRFRHLGLPALAGLSLALAVLGGHSAPAETVLWLKADGVTNATEGAGVGIWPDVSGFGNSGVAGASAPTWTLANGINGLPVLHFEAGSSQYFAIPRVVQDDFTIIAVFRTTQQDGESNNFYLGPGLINGEVGGATADFGISLRGSSGRILAGTGAPDTTIRSGLGYNDGQPHILTFKRTRSSGSLRLWVDGDQNESSDDASTASLTAPSRLLIGGQQTGVSYYTGDFAEVKIYNTALSNAERQAEENALKGKYGLGGGTAPAAPATVTTNGRKISWTESTGATSYTLSRASSPGGPYTVVATDLKTGRFVDTTAPGGTTWYYVVTATNAIGTSGASAEGQTTLQPLPTPGRVVINEIHYNGLSNAVRSDFIEIYNYSANPADLSGWRLSSAIDYTFPAGTIIPPDGYLVVAEKPETVQAMFGVAALGPWDSSLSSDGETVRLRNATNVIVSEVPYASGFPWPCEANGEGASAELINPALDEKLGSSWRSSVMTMTKLSGEVTSAGAQNNQFTPNPPPSIAEVVPAPPQPTANTPIKVAARVADANGVTSVQLAYQIVAPGNYIPAELPHPIVNHNIDTAAPLPANPAFEDPANWTTVAMNDAGTGGDAIANDGIYTGTIPGQSHRTLVRYRVTATDTAGASVRAPFADDKSRNFAVFVYNGVPDYQGVPSATLTKLPVYQFLTRKADYDQCVAYDEANRLAGGTDAWTFENWEATLVFDGVVYDHIKYRLHGGNGRYYFTSKRAFRFFFNEGYDFQNRDNDGNLMPTKWNSLTTENGWENRGTLTYSLNELINFRLWNTVGVPSPTGTWGHFRLLTNAQEQPDAYHGDFWGLIYIHEDYDRRFLDAHNLEKGNLYKLTRDDTDGPGQQRYQAPDAVIDGSDHGNIYSNLRGNRNAAYIGNHVNVDRWSLYHAVAQAVRHYDYWPEGDNNAAYYFEPVYTPENNNLGKLWVLPNDVDATWGPTWNEGRDVVYAAIFDNPAVVDLYPQYFNAVREVRDLLWQQDQINPLIDEYAAVISNFVAADSIRWKNAPADAGNYNGIGGAGITSLAALVTDMKNFAWVGGSWPGGNVGSGGRAAFLDTLQAGPAGSESSTIPATPTITYAGAAGHPVNDLKFTASAFSDPQGAGTFAAVQWRMAEITDPSAPAYNPAAKFKLEWDASYDSGAVAAPPVGPFVFPTSACQPGRAYRARVRYLDATGRWSHWSSPVQFIAGANTADLPLIVSEFLYKPSDVTPEETAAGFTDKEDFEYLEVRNVGATPLNLGGFKVSEGITFTFPANYTLAAGASAIITPNVPAFNKRYGAGKPVAGAYSGNLKNSGERLVLSTASGIALVDFTFSDSAPWPTEGDTGGYSLVLKNPSSRPDPNVAANWRASGSPGGSPGVKDDLSYAEWRATSGASAVPTDDDDQDGLSNRLEYAIGTNPVSANPGPAPVIATLTVGGVPASYVTLTFPRQANATDLTYAVEYSTNLTSWAASAVRVSATNNFDGTTTEVWRAPTAIGGGSTGFLRLRVTAP